MTLKSSLIQGRPSPYVFSSSQPPALRIFLLGVRGSGKTTHGHWLAQQLGLFHLQFRERLQELILAKTRTRVPYADEVEPPEEPPSELQSLLQAQTQSTTSPVEPKVDSNQQEILTGNKDHIEVGAEKISWSTKVKIKLPLNMRKSFHLFLSLSQHKDGKDFYLS